MVRAVLRHDDLGFGEIIVDELPAQLVEEGTRGALSDGRHHLFRWRVIRMGHPAPRLLGEKRIRSPVDALAGVSALAEIIDHRDVLTHKLGRGTPVAPKPLAGKSGCAVRAVAVGL